MSELRKVIGHNIRIGRTKRNISLEELAQSIETGPAYLSLAEQGHRGLSVVQLIKISELLHISVEALCTKKESDETSDSE